MDEGQVQKIEINNKKFSWKRISKTVCIIVLIFSVVASVYFVLNLRPVKIRLASWFLDNREHYTPCEILPFLPQVKKELVKHADVVDKIKSLGAFDVSAHEIKCYMLDGKNYFPKGEIVISYGTHAQRKAIEKLIGDNFFGIPYRGENH
jgi:hypothetical protein